MVHRGFHVDERPVAQLVDDPEQGLVEIRLEILAVRESAHAERIAIGREHGDALADVLGGRAVHDGVAAGLELPGALAGRDHEGRAPELRHCRLKGRQSTQRRIEEHQPQDLVRERPALRRILQPLGERQEIEDLRALEIGEVEKAVHAALSHAAPLMREWSTTRRAADRRDSRSVCRRATIAARWDPRSFR